MKWMAFLVMTVVLAGCMKDDPATEPSATSAECLEQGLILNATSGLCEASPFATEDFEDPAHHCVVTQQADRVHAPDLVGNPWELGQSWTYALAINEDDLGTTQLIYYADQDFDGAGVPLHYMVGTPTREEALQHAVESNNPMIGRIHRLLYSPHESGDHANMFNFPLCDGSSWTTRFFGEQFTLTASEADIAVPGQTGPGFLINGTSPGGSTLALSYSPLAQWFTFIDLDRANGETVDMTLDRMDTGYSGEAYFLRGQQDESIGVSATATNVPFAREDGNDGPYDSIGVQLSGAAGPGVMRIELVDPAGTTQWTTDILGTGPTGASALLEVPYTAGDWLLRATGALESSTLSVDVVSIYDRSDSV